MDLIGVAIVVVALIVGAGAHYFTKKNDSPAEQAAEAVLKAKGIDVDFSAADKEKEDDNKANQ